ncbi:MAG: isocitrate/isopropylmalate dehydrogenase family protein [Nitrososphaerota archaeon]
MTIKRVAVIPGDGIGPEVINEGIKVLDSALRAEGSKIMWDYFDFSADYYLKTGKLLEEYDLKKLESYDSIYLGAVGDPRVAIGILEEGIILKLRYYFDQFINLRPIKLYEGVETVLKNKSSKDINMVFVRENTEDFYSGLGKRVNERKANERLIFTRKNYEIDFNIETSASGTSDLGSFAYQLGVVTEIGAARVQKFAFEYAKAHNLNKITLVDKANVMPKYYGLWRETFESISSKYPEISSEEIHADAAAMWMVKNPEKFKVVVLPNLFGDILSDLGASLQGGLGFAPGGNINPYGISMFEPIHGSAPKYKGKNIVNPIATILAGKMMLETLGLSKAANRIENAVAKVLKEGKIRTKDMNGVNSTSQMGDEIARVVSTLEE